MSPKAGVVVEVEVGAAGEAGVGAEGVVEQEA